MTLLRDIKKRSKPWTMLTAYDAPTAEILETAGIDIILVGDSLGMVILGYPSTHDVTVDDMVHHIKAVRRGAPHSFVIGDLPRLGVHLGPKQTLKSAKRLIKAGCDAVKLEWDHHTLSSLNVLRQHKIPVCAHIGLTPQSVGPHNGYKVRGKDPKDAAELLATAKKLEKHGILMLLLECVPWQVAKLITATVSVPTIGIGSGPDCDGQVLVFHDITGLFKKFTPKFVKRYSDALPILEKAVLRYKNDVQRRAFPSRTRHSYRMKPDAFSVFKKSLKPVP